MNIMSALRSLWPHRDASADADFEAGGWLQSRYYRLLLRLHDNPELPESRRDLVLRELRLRDDTRTTVVALFLVMLFALICVSLAQHQISRATRLNDSEALAALWGVGTLTAAALLGFLFGIPRAAQQPAGPTLDARGREVRAAGLTPNTNLEQISDWLTKIIVGVGLVEARSIAAHAIALAQFMSATSGGVASPSLALAILITFGGLGFLLGYLTTRMFLSPVFSLADGALTGGGDVAIEAKAVLDAPVTPADRADAPSPADAPEAAQKSARRLLSRRRAPRVDDPFEARYARAKSLLLVGRYARAAVEYGSLVADRPDDIRLRRERLWALFKRGPQWGPEISTAVEWLYPRRDREGETRKVYLSLTFHLLYANTVDAAQRVIALVDEFAVKNGRPTAGLLINKACAYAMLARLNPAERADAAGKAAATIRQILALDPSVADRLRAMMNPDAEDDDFAVFRNEPFVRTALGLEPE